MANPILSKSSGFNQKQVFTGEYIAPETSNQQAGSQTSWNPVGQSVFGDVASHMTYSGVISKTVICFAIILVTGFLSWQIPALAIIGGIAGFVLGLVNSFKRQPSVALTLLYSAAEGLFLGGISSMFEHLSKGVVLQAVLGTIVVFGVVLALFSSGKVRTSPKLNKIVFIAGISYLAFSLIDMVLTMTNVIQNPWGARGFEVFGIPLGGLIGIVAILMAAYTLIGDFETIEYGVQRGLPDKYGWQGAFGLVSSLIWIYVEILRILAIFANSDD